MIEPLLSLAFTLHSSRGTLAVLLGSGISRGAGIPTGWEIVLDLCRKIAALHGEAAEPDPAAWYAAKFAREPSYSELLAALASTPTARQQLLSAYFEATAEETERGVKVPSQAHRAIARLVAGGYIRVVLTTNFDRLLERALEEAGVAPSVIASRDAAKGALPLVHSRCTVIKLHGDYLDTRLLNTPEELSAYARPMNQLLDRVFDEFGLIVCGWSAEWDTALRAALTRCSTCRFPSFWAQRGPASQLARDLQAARQMAVITAADANALFVELEQRVLALETLNQPHPLSVASARAMVKRYLPRDEDRIPLHDLIMGETRRLILYLSDDRAFPLEGIAPNPEMFRQRAAQYEAATAILRSMAAVVGQFGRAEQVEEIALAIQGLIDSMQSGGGYTVLLRFRHYPVLLILYAAMVSAVVARNYVALRILMLEIWHRAGSEVQPYALDMFPQWLTQHEVLQWLPGMDRRYTPLSDHMNALLFADLRETVSSEREFNCAFDKLQYLVACAVSDHRQFKPTDEQRRVPPGAYCWRSDLRRDSVDSLDAEISRQGNTHPLLRAGLFGGNVEGYRTATGVVRALMADLDARWGW